MRKVTPFLSSVAIMAVLTLLQRLFLVQSDTGKQWAIVVMWFGLCNWYLRSPKTQIAPEPDQRPKRGRPPRPARLGNL
jgi:hypothetical protein